MNITQIIGIIIFSLLGQTGMAAGIAKVHISNQKVDLGEVMHSEFAEGSFLLGNSGNAPLKVMEIKSSCGCTVVDFEPGTIIAPGQKKAIKVSVDTIGKVGEIRKKLTVISNDPLTPELDMFVYVRVKLADHESPDRSAIFKNTCRYCHSEPAKDQLGEALFESVCYMCHGHYGLGGVARRINNFAYISNNDDEYFRRVIADGVPDSSMPGFSSSKGGPLSDEQVDSLVTLMRWWEEGYVFKKNEMRQFK